MCLDLTLFTCPECSQEAIVERCAHGRTPNPALLCSLDYAARCDLADIDTIAPEDERMDHNTIPPALRDAYHWFRGRTGVVGRDASAALTLARAELEARERGLRFVWEDDPEPYETDDGIPEPGRVECCAVYGPEDVQTLASLRDRVPLASLCGIADADDDCRRIVQAELACEALADLDARPAPVTWYVASTAGGHYVEESVDLDRLIATVRDEILSPDDGAQDDVLITAGARVVAVCLSDGRVVRLDGPAVTVITERFTTMPTGAAGYQQN